MLRRLTALASRRSAAPRAAAGTKGHFWSVLPRSTQLSLALAAIGGLGAIGQTIPNPSFETDTFATFPGYISGNGPITGWTGEPAARVGLNPAGGSPFADNGTLPDGKNAAFIQANVDDPATPTTLSTTVTGLTSGKTYKVRFQANARNGQVGNLRVAVDGTEIVATSVWSAGGANPYWYIAFEFTAAGSTAALTLSNDATTDQTVNVDNFVIAESTGSWKVNAWTGDEDSGVDSKYFYTHAYNFGSSASPDINGVTFTGLAGGSPTVADRLATTYFGNVYNADANSVTAAGQATAALATDFVYGGTIPVGSYQAITMLGLTPGTEYIATLYTVGWDEPSLTARWADVSIGNDHFTFNQDLFFTDGGLTVSCRYTADETGTAMLKIIPINPNNQSIHTYGFSNREAVSRNVAPVILSEPQGSVVSPGVDVSFAVSATGLPVPTYQWRFKGANINGANAATYTVTGVTAANAGDYDVVVANSVSSVTSKAAKLTVGVPMENPSFEVDIFPTWPGYVRDNSPITSWTTLGGHGINPVEDGRGPFADNGIIPNGTHVAFMQDAGALTQTVSGLSAGSLYYVHYYENARNGGTPSMEVKVDGTTVVAVHGVTQVGGGAYHEVYSDVFTAAGTSAELSFIKGVIEGADTTALIDNVAIIPVPAGTAPFITSNPQPQLVSVGDSATFTAHAVGSPTLTYQWLKNGVAIDQATGTSFTLSNIQKVDEADYALKVTSEAGTATSAAAKLTVYEPIPDLFSTGLDDKRQPLADGATDPHWRLIDNPDGGTPEAIVQTPPGAWLANNAAGKWIGPKQDTVASPVGQYTYRTVLDLTGRDPSTLVIEGVWAVDNAGRDIRVNGLSTGNPQNTAGFASWTTFRIDSSNASFIAGSNSLEFVVDNLTDPGYTGLRMQIVRSNLRIPPGTPPEILTQPIGTEMAEGETLTLTATARGTAPLAYQWNKDGVAIPGQTTLTLTIPNVTSADSGAYTITVSNSVGSKTSDPANVCVCLRPLPVAFGTGVDASGALLADAAVDPHYKMTVSPDPTYVGPDAVAINNVWPIAPAGPWLANGPGSRWIGPQPDQTAAGGNYAGDYTYETTVDLTGYDVTKVKLVGGWASDNGGLDILLNGTSLGLTNPGFGSLNPFTITSGLVAGKNTLAFVMNNAAGDTELNPTGLRVDLRALLTIEPAVKPALTITRNAGNVSVSWAPAAAGQQLQSAPAVTGPWTEVSNATNPYSTATSGAATFYRVVKP